MNHQLGKYTILAELGRGGFGTVYKAEDPIGRIVALKVLHPGWDQQPDVLMRFRREAMAGGSLFHQRIATILDIEETEGQLYLVMRYVEGKTLREEIKTKGKLSWQEAKKIIEEIAEGLMAAHQAGYIHRDVKPENILLGKEGAVLTDFGLTKAIEGSVIASTKGVTGTYKYIAPEIWLGETITPKVDVYSLACVLHEIVSGESLFKGDSAPAVMTQHLIKGPQIPERYPQGYPDGLRELLKAGLVKEAEERLGLQEFIKQLQELGSSPREKRTIAEIPAIITTNQKKQAEPQAGQIKTIDQKRDKLPLRTYVLKIENQIDNGQIDQAIAHCKHILQTYPKHIDSYRLLGKALLEKQKYRDASDIFQRLLSCILDDFVSHIGMSVIRDFENKLDAAIWHMERAFEVQPSNEAVQEELRRLYVSRDGIAPPKIRFTRGALVRKYMSVASYNQAIPEILAALSEDPNRVDLEVILAKIKFLQGKYIESKVTCSKILTKVPYCYEANRILSIINKDLLNSENDNVYRQRINDLDPYNNFLTDKIFSPTDVPDGAVLIDYLC